jgi:hypothetical protein
VIQSVRIKVADKTFELTMDEAIELKADLGRLIPDQIPAPWLSPANPTPWYPPAYGMIPGDGRTVVG